MAGPSRIAAGSTGPAAGRLAGLRKHGLPALAPDFRLTASGRLAGSSAHLPRWAGLLAAPQVAVVGGIWPCQSEGGSCQWTGVGGPARGRGSS